ncbi:hypothetical protein HLB44_26730 [Aquincola sp. S2]|uniref:Delta-60 repeat domain-containing protein n=1 Tax=Pseudaquabacterium terrae TaxID=2732868 RepID=A0ABX2EPV6_9BURK|nr:delta-60 repeat domain-containing protein [Aquabacterium terrae]NRF70604.1 hypothetical protein [Aquabacterium terrae]
MHSPLARWATSALLASLLTACGGGGEDTATPTQVPAASVPQAAAQALTATATRKRALAVQATGLAVFDPEAAANQLMDFAEATFPAYFPVHASTASLAPFVYRHYGATGVYLGVVLDDGAFVKGGVYVMGGAFGNDPLHVGQVTDFITPTAPGARSTPASDKVQVVQGSSTALRVNVERLNGFGGPMQLALSGLPAGVTAAAVTVAPGAAFVDFQLVAQAAAPHSLPTTALLTASAAFGSRNVAASGNVTVTVRGVPGAVDTSFGGGTQITPVANSEDYAHAVAVQADGKVLTAGTTAISTGTVVALTRHLRDGGLDPAFGTGGKVITQVGARGDSARALAVQPDGKIIVAGWTDATGIDANFLVLRYLGDGTLDPAFADGGRFVLPIGAGNGTDRAHAVVVQSDGKIVVAGTTLTSTSASGQDFALIRLTVQGTLDAGFGQGGKVVTPMQTHSGGDVIYALALPVIDGEERILAVGGEGDFMAARYTPSGTLDATFGQGGKVVGLFGRNIGAARSVVLLPGGRIVLAGGIYNDFAAAQLSASGTLDASFGQGGLVTVPVSASNWDNATAVVRQADGKLLLGGWSYRDNSSAGDFVALRLLPGGALDTQFGEQGIAIRPVATGTRSDSARGMVLQSDDRVPTVRAILGGEVSGSNYDFGLLRLWL